MKATNATTHHRTFRAEVAPGIYLVTDAEAEVGLHDDGVPWSGVEYLLHRYEDEDGRRIDVDSWPWMLAYMRDVRFNRHDPHTDAVTDWAEELETAAEIENTKGAEAPVTSDGRDNREAEL